MNILNAIVGTRPASYWPLNDAAFATTVHDEMGSHSGTVADSGVYLGVVPFGRSLAPFFDGEVGSVITIPDDDRYSHTYADAITVACWILPLALDFQHTEGSLAREPYIHFIEKAVRSNNEVEWAMRLYDADGDRPSRLSFYMFKAGIPAGKGAGAYMQYGLSANDSMPVELGRWLFLIGQGEGWVDGADTTTGAKFYKQGIQAIRTPGDKYNNPEWNVRPHNGPGPIAITIGKTASRDAVAHVAIWNRLLAADEIELIRSEGMAEIHSPLEYRIPEPKFRSQE